MGQELSLKHSNDTLSLFPPINGSGTSFFTDYRFDDVVNNNYYENNKFKRSHKISRLKKSFSECFRSKFSRLKEIDSDSYSGEIMNSRKAHNDKSDLVFTECRSRRLTDANETLVSQDLPRDIRDIHDQLATLMQLLTLPGADSSLCNTRDVLSQTSGHDPDWERQRDALIATQQEKLSSLSVDLANKNQQIERYARELAVLKAQQTRHRVDNTNTNSMAAFLRDIRERVMLAPNDLDKMDEVINYVSSYFPSHRYLAEKSNVAVISPCSNSTSSNPFIDPLDNSDDLKETKLICFLDHSDTPYVSTIPFSFTQITLSKVKYYTRSVMPKNANCRYIFRSRCTSSGQRQEEISRDTDLVPVQDNKIVVRILV